MVTLKSVDLKMLRGTYTAAQEEALMEALKPLIGKRFKNSRALMNAVEERTYKLLHNYNDGIDSDSKHIWIATDDPYAYTLGCVKKGIGDIIVKAFRVN